MPESLEKARARTKAHAARRKADGWRRVDVYLDADTLSALDALRGAAGETRGACLSRLIREARESAS
jgi:hypothetical protein